MKKIFSLILVLVICFSLIGCGTSSQEIEKTTLEEEIASLEEYKQSLLDEINTLKEDNKLYTYVVKFEVKQSHFSLDISNHIKDAMNTLEFEVPVSRTFYDSVEKGDVIDDSFRMGSFLMKGSFGSWKVKVIDKYIQEEIIEN